MSAINELDSEAMIASQHFPFVHFWPDGRIEHVASASEFELVDKDSVLGSEWDHTVLESADEITQHEDAASFRIVFSRRRGDDSVIGRYEAIWIASKKVGDWRVQFRHGAIEL
jgi:hypothetical protein